LSYSKILCTGKALNPPTILWLPQCPSRLDLNQQYLGTGILHDEVWQYPMTIRNPQNPFMFVPQHRGVRLQLSYRGYFIATTSIGPLVKTLGGIYPLGPSMQVLTRMILHPLNLQVRLSFPFLWGMMEG
jgi:hypothetical protein